MISSRRKSTVSFAVLLLAAGLAPPLAAQQESWEKLSGETQALYQQGKYADALPVAQEALRVAEASFGPEHPNVAKSLNNLAALYHAQGKYAEAEEFLKRSLAIKEKALGPDDPDVAASLNNLAALYDDQGKHSEAEPLLRRSLAIREKALGSGHPDVARSLNNLAVLYEAQGKHADAEPLFKRLRRPWVRITPTWLQASTTSRRSMMRRTNTPRPSHFTSAL